MLLLNKLVNASPKTNAASFSSALSIIIVYFLKLPTEVAFAIVFVIVTLTTALVPATKKFIDEQHNEDLSGD